MGGAYGGSLRALETYLAYSEQNRFVHDLLIYYPTPGDERVRSLVRKLWTLYDTPLPTSGNDVAKATGGLRAALKRSAFGPVLAQMRDWMGLAQGLPTARRLVRALLATDYDVIHVNNTFTYQVPTLLAAWKARKPVVAHVRGPVERGVFSRLMMRLTDCVATINHSLEKELSTWGVGVAVRTCYDGVELPVADPSVSSDWRAALVRPGAVLVGSVGRLDKGKGYEVLVRAARQVVAARPQVNFAVAGEGPLKASLEGLVGQLGLADHFRFIGFSSDVVSFLAALDLFVSPSLREGGPLVVAEAALVGKPVVATSVGYCPEIIASGCTGELVPPGNPDALARALLRALECKGIAALPRKGAFQAVSSLFDPEVNARLFDEIVQQACRNRIRKRPFLG